MKKTASIFCSLLVLRSGEGFFGPVRSWSRPASPAVVQRRDSEREGATRTSVWTATERRSGVRVYQLPPKGFAPSEDEVDYGDMIAAPPGYEPDM